jgi:hypothetical protein
MILYDGLFFVFLIVFMLIALSFVHLRGQIIILNIQLEATDIKLEMLTTTAGQEIKRLQDKVY